MEEKTSTTIDREERQWPSGPWDGEPDRVQWPDAATGLPCLALRHPYFGHWCGYVGIDRGHPLHGRSHDGDLALAVHGGLTFFGPCDGGVGICHVPALGEPEHVWWLGFDCAHYQDYSPNNARLAAERGYPFTIRPDEVYRTLDYVRQQCASLARQLIDFLLP